jgi:hypothetical protein
MAVNRQGFAAMEPTNASLAAKRRVFSLGISLAYSSSTNEHIMSTTLQALELNFGHLYANTARAARELLTLTPGNFGVDPATIADMNDLQLLRAADACRFLFNNLPAATIHG